MTTGFVQTKVDLGWIISERKYIAKFPYRDINKVVRTEASCDCLNIANEDKYNRLIVTLRPKKVPHHLIEEGIKNYKTNKTITVTYTTNDAPNEMKQVILVIEGTVMDKT